MKRPRPHFVRGQGRASETPIEGEAMGDHKGRPFVGIFPTPRQNGKGTLRQAQSQSPDLTLKPGQSLAA